MIDICKEGVSPEHLFFGFPCCWLYLYGLSKHKCFVCEGQLMKILGVIFRGNQEKKMMSNFLTQEL